MKRNRTLILVGLLFTFLQTPAQSPWDLIELANAEAKILKVANSGKENQIIYKTFETKEGVISVFLPPLSSSVTISGTVYAEPAGRSKDGSASLLALKKYGLTLGNLKIPVQKGSFRLQLPAYSPQQSISLTLQNETGQIIKNEPISITTDPMTGGSTVIPPYMTANDAATIIGNFDGDLSNTSVTINGEKVELLAESLSTLYFRTPLTYTGPVSVICSENSQVQTGKTNVIKLDLSADKTTLRRGQQTTLHIKISGLQGLKENVPVTIENTSPSVINLERGNTQHLVINSSIDAASGVFETSRNIQSLKNGSFSVNVSITPFTSSTRK